MFIEVIRRMTKRIENGQSDSITPFLLD